MSHTRPTATGWVTGQQGEPVEVQADPPGDGIGPDLTPPDQIDGQDPREYKRLAKDHRAALKGDGERPDISAPEPNDLAPEPRPDDPREGKADR